MLIAVMLAGLANAQPQPTLGQIEAMPPASAGLLILPQTNTSIAKVARATDPMAPPGQLELELIEAPFHLANGCLRQRWTATFRHGQDQAEADATWASASVKPEVSLPTTDDCPEDGYTMLSGDIDPAEALTFLHVLDRISSGAIRATFACRSRLEPAFCSSPRATRAGLRANRPWNVLRLNGLAELWLRQPGELVTTVRFRPDDPTRVSIVRDLPPPF